MDYKKLKELFGINFIGLDELESIHKKLNLYSPYKLINDIPPLPYSFDFLKPYRNSHVLFLGIPLHIDGSILTINSLRNLFGVNPEKNEPCFYNQDWYIKEAFANSTFKLGWYLISKSIINETRGVSIQNITKLESINQGFPSAVLITYYFYLYFFHTKKEILFQNDYVWCSDKDSNGDQIYVGKYTDPLGINKNGFEIHRHLLIKSNYGAIELL